MIVLDEQLLASKIELEITKWYRGAVRFIIELRPDTLCSPERFNRSNRVKGVDLQYPPAANLTLVKQVGVAGVIGICSLLGIKDNLVVLFSLAFALVGL